MHLQLSVCKRGLDLGLAVLGCVLHSLRQGFDGDDAEFDLHTEGPAPGRNTGNGPIAQRSRASARLGLLAWPDDSFESHSSANGTSGSESVEVATIDVHAERAQLLSIRALPADSLLGLRKVIKESTDLVCDFMREAALSRLGPLLMMPLSTAHHRDQRACVADAFAQLGVRRPSIARSKHGMAASQQLQQVGLFETLAGRAAGIVSPALTCMSWLAAVLALEPNLGGDCPKSLRPATAFLARWGLSSQTMATLSSLCDQYLLLGTPDGRLAELAIRELVASPHVRQVSAIAPTLYHGIAGTRVRLLPCLLSLLEDGFCTLGADQNVPRSMRRAGLLAAALRQVLEAASGITMQVGEIRAAVTSGQFDGLSGSVKSLCAHCVEFDALCQCAAPMVLSTFEWDTRGSEAGTEHGGLQASSESDGAARF